MEVAVRSYEEADYEGVKKNLLEAGLYDAGADSPEALSRAIKGNPNAILVALSDGEIAGTVYIETGWYAFIFRLAVRADYRNKGIASALLARAESIIKELGYTECGLYVDAEDGELLLWYEKRGYNRSVKNYNSMWKKI